MSFVYAVRADVTGPENDCDRGRTSVRELQALRERSGLTIREVAKAAGTSVSTTGDCFSGRHLPLDREQFTRILAACGEDDQERIEAWQAALARVRRSPGRGAVSRRTGDSPGSRRLTSAGSSAGRTSPS